MPKAVTTTGDEERPALRLGQPAIEHVWFDLARVGLYLQWPEAVVGLRKNQTFAALANVALLAGRQCPLMALLGHGLHRQS